MTDRLFGHIPNVSEGEIFPDRMSLSKATVHRPPQAGISGAAAEGADSIVLSGGYEDDEDFGDQIIYTGHGGQDPNTRKQIADQTLTRQNMALAMSSQEGLPVRVIRGAKHKSPLSPVSGYKYGGLYRIEEFWHEKGHSGFRVWRFRLVKIVSGENLEKTHETSSCPEGNKETKRVECTTTRIIRDTVISRKVKLLYDYTCQVCGTRLEGPAGPYAEGAHIKPLGKPHNGPDSLANLLCLCPNHHLLFDLGAFGVDVSLTLINLAGTLTKHPKHSIDKEMLSYHRDHFGLLN